MSRDVSTLRKIYTQDNDAALGIIVNKPARRQKIHFLSQSRRPEVEWRELKNDASVHLTTSKASDYYIEKSRLRFDVLVRICEYDIERSENH